MHVFVFVVVSRFSVYSVCNVQAITNSG